MASRKATKAETTRGIRASRRAKGETKQGPRKKTADAVEALSADTGTYVETAEGAGRATGLSEDIGMQDITAMERLQSGAFLGDVDERPAPDTARAQRAVAEKEYWETFGRTPAGRGEMEKALSTIRGIAEGAPSRGRATTPQEARVERRTRSERAQRAIASARRSVEYDRAGFPVRVLPPDVPLTESDALARQQFFLGNESLRTAQPGVTKIPTITGEGTVGEKTIIRPTRQYIASVQKTRVRPAEKEAAEAEAILKRAEVVEKIGKTAAGRVVEDVTAKPVTTVEITEGGAPEARTSTTRGMTKVEAARLPESEGGLTQSEKTALYGRPVGEVRSPKVTRVVGSAEITEDFRSNVAAKRAAAEAAKTAPIDPSEIKTLEGLPSTAIDPEDLASYVERAQASKNPLRYEGARPEPSRMPKSLGSSRQKSRGVAGQTPVGLTDAEADERIAAISGSNPTERLAEQFKLTDPARQADILARMRAARKPEGSVIPVRKEDVSPEVAQKVNTGTFAQVARGRRRLGDRAGRPVGSQTVDEAARITAAEDYLQKEIANDLMGGRDVTSTSQAALHIRAADARRVGRALDQTRLARSGMAEPTDEQIVLGQRVATHKAATAAVNQHLADVESHLFRQREAATGYAKAAFSTIPKGSIGDVASGVASLGSARATAKAAGAAGAERYRQSAYWERGEGGAGAVRSTVDVEGVQKAFETPRAPTMQVTPKAEPIVRPADTEADLARQRRAALMATPEGRAQIESARTEGAAFLARPEVPAETTAPATRNYRNMEYPPLANTPYGYVGAASREISKIRSAASSAPKGSPERMLPHFGNKMAQIGYSANKARGASNILQPASTMAPFSPGQEEKVNSSGIKYRSEGRAAPTNGGFFQRVANKGQFGA